MFVPTFDVGCLSRAVYQMNCSSVLHMQNIAAKNCQDCEGHKNLSIIRVVVIFSPPPTRLQRQYTRESNTADKVR